MPGKTENSTGSATATSNTTAENDYDIAVVGLGPVGCTACLLLAAAGLKVIAFERDRQVYRLPRAVNMDGEVIRGFQRIGLGDSINALMQSVRPGDRVGFANSQREWLFGQEVRDFGTNGWQPMNFFDQPEVDGYLRDICTAQPNVTPKVGWNVSAVTDNGNDVTIIASPLDSDSASSFNARYLLGCDGASSYIRREIGSDWHNLGYDHDWLVVDVVAHPGNTLDHTTLQVCDPDRITTYVCTKDPYRRWEFKLNSGETWEEMLEPARIAELIERWTPAGTYEVRRAAMYQFHAATADSWRLGNLFIAGDAAHQTPPFLGQGMNAGMRDVINFAWKLPLVLQGVANESLLDTYQSERDAHAADLVEWAVAIGRLMDHLAEVEAAERSGKPAPATPAQSASAGYGQGREQPPLRAGVFHLEQVSDTGSTGYLFSQPIVMAGNGEELRLDELLGPGFSIVGRTAADLACSAAAEAVLQHLNVRKVALEGLQEVRGHYDRLFEQHKVAIVRPDRYVFGHATSDISLDDLIGELSEKLCLRLE